METINIKQITFDDEDSKLLFKHQSNLLYKAKNIQKFILPKLKAILEEALSRVRKIYSIDVLSEGSHIHYSPHFRDEQQRKRNLKFDYTWAIAGITGLRKNIWKGFEKKDGADLKIMGFYLEFGFYEQGILLRFRSEINLLSYNSHKKYFNFIKQNSQFIQKIISLSGLKPLAIYDNTSSVERFLDELTESEIEDLIFQKQVPLPISSKDLEDLINAFVFFYPIYDSMVRIAKGEDVIFEKLVDVLFDDIQYPEEIPTVHSDKLFEGAKRIITVNAYERNSQARKKCIEHYGTTCFVCGFDFQKKYGEWGYGFIHVHHLTPIVEVGESYEIDPIMDLRPVCPNCHSMLHRGEQTLTVDELKNVVIEKSKA